MRSRSWTNVRNPEYLEGRNRYPTFSALFQNRLTPTAHPARDRRRDGEDALRRAEGPLEQVVGVGVAAHDPVDDHDVRRRQIELGAVADLNVVLSPTPRDSRQLPGLVDRLRGQVEPRPAHRTPGDRLDREVSDPASDVEDRAIGDPRIRDRVEQRRGDLRGRRLPRRLRRPVVHPVVEAAAFGFGFSHGPTVPERRNHRNLWPDGRRIGSPMSADRSRLRPRGARLAREPDRRGRCRPGRRGVRQGGGPERRLDRRARGDRAARRRRQAVRRQGGAPRRRERERGDRARARGYRRVRPADVDRRAARARREPRPVQPRRERDPRRLARARRTRPRTRSGSRCTGRSADRTPTCSRCRS